MVTESTRLKSWLVAVETGKVAKYDKVQYALIKYWFDLLQDIKNKKQENIIRETYEKLPVFWENILGNIISAARYARIRQIEPNYIDKFIDDIQFYSEYSSNPFPYYIIQPNLVPLHIIASAANIINSYDLIFPHSDKNSKTFLSLCGLPQNIYKSFEIYEFVLSFAKGTDLKFGLALIRSYFAAKTIQHQWRHYIRTKRAANTIQRVWKRQISSPFTIIGINRLNREFSEMIEA